MVFGLCEFHKWLYKPGKIKCIKRSAKNFQGSVCNVSNLKIKSDFTTRHFIL